MFFPDRKKRQINLGGASHASSPSLLDEAKILRNERSSQKKRLDATIRLQRVWRGVLERRRVLEQLRQRFYAEPHTLNGMRCLAITGGDKELSVWSEGDILQLERESSWIVLARKIAQKLLAAVAANPLGPYAPHYVQALVRFLSHQPVANHLLNYLVPRGYYQCISQAILAIPLDRKTSPILPQLTQLVMIPFSVYDGASEYQTCFNALVRHILTIPLLPNRLPLPALSQLSSALPLPSFHLVSFDGISSATTAEKAHLLANLLMFTPPRYGKLPAKAFNTYLTFLAKTLNSIPAGALEVPELRKELVWNDDSDHDDLGTQPGPPGPAISLDEKTLSRLSTLTKATHIASLLKIVKSTNLELCAFVLALTSAMPRARDSVNTSFLIHSGGSLIKELYRGYVRTSPLGKDPTTRLSSPDGLQQWAPLLLLVQLYEQALATMGDDEFFGNAASGTSAARNPLSLDELKSFSRKLLNIAYSLYWRDPDLMSSFHASPSPEIRISWHGARERITRCLLAINSRDSRKPFLPADHWLVPGIGKSEGDMDTDRDMQNFVEAAVFEEQQLSAEQVETQQSRTTTRVISSKWMTMSPRLNVLNNIPFAIPFEVRVAIFRHFVLNDARQQRSDSDVFMYDSFGRRRTRITVRRENIAQDGFDKLGEADLKMPVEIEFLDQWGQPEAGIDGGGVFKEFFTSLCKEVFDTNRGLWLTNKKNELYPNPHPYATEPHSLNWYRFIGRILGKAMYEGILVDVAFAGFFLAKWLGKESNLNDLFSLDPELYNGLIFLKHYAGNVDDLALNFSVSVEELGVQKSYDLIPNGSNVPVTKENRLRYIALVSHFRLSKQIRKQSEAFFDGLSSMIQGRWVRMFNQQEVQILLGGVDSPIDLEDLRKHTNYGGLYSDSEHTVQMFWKVVNDLDQSQRRSLLRFVSSCSRPPLLGFKELTPNFCIRDAGEDQHRLPTASTCINLLKLPRYKSEKILRLKLVQAINSGAGFDLS